MATGSKAGQEWTASGQATPDNQAGQPDAPRMDPPADDAWDLPALPGEQAALEALRWNWGVAYEIGVDDSQWWCRRRDGIGGRETAATPDLLHSQIVNDYTDLPVRRQPPPSGGTPASAPTPAGHPRSVWRFTRGLGAPPGKYCGARRSWPKDSGQYQPAPSAVVEVGVRLCDG
jgi:hypothetical protein